MNTDNFYTRRLRRLKWIILGIAALFIAAIEAYYYFIRGVPLVDDFVDWLIGMAVAVALIEIVFRAVTKLQSRLQQEIAERKQAEEELRESEEKNRVLLEAIPDLIFRLSKDGAFLDFVHAKNMDLFAPPGEFLGKKVYEVFPPKEAQQAMRYVERALQTGETQIFEYQLMLSGKMRDYEARYVVSGEDEVLAIVRDITERKRAEKELREKEEHLRAVVASAPIVLFAINHEGIITFSEGKDLDALGLKPGESIGRSAFEVFRDAPQVGEDIYRALAGEESTSVIELAGRTFETRLSPLRDQNGGITGVVGVAIDITECKQMEEELIRLSSAVRTSIDSIVLSDIKGKIIDVNEATLEMYGTDDKEDLIGKSSFDFIAPEDREKAFAGMMETLEKGYIKSREYHIITKNGNKIPVEVNATLLVDVEGKPIGFVSITRDITKRKRAEEALKESE